MAWFCSAVDTSNEPRQKIARKEPARTSEPTARLPSFRPLLRPPPPSLETLPSRARRRLPYRGVFRHAAGSPIGQLPCVNPNHVSWNDILSLRRDEDIFQEWRNLVHSILDELYNRKEDFTDIEREFEEVSRERFREWSIKLEVERMRRSAFNAFFEGARQVSIQLIGAGLAVAAVDAAISGNSKTAVALAGGAVVAGLQNTGPEIIKALGEVWRAMSSHEERRSLEHHILALGL
jgi:hypothetical protein